MGVSERPEPCIGAGAETRQVLYTAVIVADFRGGINVRYYARPAVLHPAPCAEAGGRPNGPTSGCRPGGPGPRDVRTRRCSSAPDGVRAAIPAKNVSPPAPRLTRIFREARRAAAQETPWANQLGHVDMVPGAMA